MNYTHAGSASLLAGTSTIAAPAGTAKHGYIGQLDDATFLTTDPGAVTWSIASGLITDVSATGRATAGLVFENTSAPVPGGPLRKKVIFSPRLDGRTYIVESRLTLADPWQSLVSSTQSDNGMERTVTDLNATGAKKFYHVEITKP